METVDKTILNKALTTAANLGYTEEVEIYRCGANNRIPKFLDSYVKAELETVERNKKQEKEELELFKKLKAKYEPKTCETEKSEGKKNTSMKDLFIDALNSCNGKKYTDEEIMELVEKGIAGALSPESMKSILKNPIFVGMHR